MSFTSLETIFSVLEWRFLHFTNSKSAATCGAHCKCVSVLHTDSLLAPLEGELQAAGDGALREARRCLSDPGMRHPACCVDGVDGTNASPSHHLQVPFGDL